jgi:hypothetical protein
MKTNRIVLAEWSSDDIYIDIDWPLVHKQIGLDQLEWLMDLPLSHCQLILDKGSTNSKLVAEFYNQQTLLTYHLMWSRG